MNYQENILEKYLYTETLSYKEMVNITEETKFFKLRNVKKEKTKENENFIKIMKKRNNEENIVNEKGSGLYNFKTGNTVIQLDVCVGKEYLSIKPYILYNKDDIQTDFLKLIKLDEILSDLIEAI